MRKGTLFISTALTAFTLAVLFGVVRAYQQAAAPPIAAPGPGATIIEAPAASPPAPAPVLTPEQAAALAARLMGGQDLYSIESLDFNGVNAYLVTFVSGDQIYMSLDGQILLIAPAQPAFNDSSAATSRRSRGGDGSEAEDDDD